MFKLEETSQKVVPKKKKRLDIKLEDHLGDATTEWWKFQMGKRRKQRGENQQNTPGEFPNPETHVC